MNKLLLLSNKFSGEKILVTTAYVRTSENKWEQVGTSGQSVGQCGKNWKKKVINQRNTPPTTTSKEEMIESTTNLGTKYADSTQSGFNYLTIVAKRLLSVKVK